MKQAEGPDEHDRIARHQGRLDSSRHADIVWACIGSEEEHVSAAALTTAYGITIGAIMVIATLM